MRVKIMLPKDSFVNSIDVKEGARILFVTGAGISAGSGLPTYYGEGGTYTNMGASPEQVINAANMEKYPHVIWDATYSLMRQGMVAEPSVAHNAISQIQKIVGKGNSLIFTQNVDTLHEKAGSVDIIHIHGRADRSECRQCFSNHGALKRYKSTADALDTYQEGVCPKCPDCGGRLRPDIVPFDGLINSDLYQRAINFTGEPVDYVFVIGTQALFPYVQELIFQASMAGGLVINIDPDKFLNEQFDYHFRMTADLFFSRFDYE